MRIVTSIAVATSMAVGLVVAQAPTSSAADDESGHTVVLISGNADDLPRPDSLMVDVLSAAGYDIVAVDDDDIDGNVAIDSATVGIISSSVLPHKIPTSLGASDLPLLNLEGFVSDDLGLATRSGQQTTNKNSIVMNEAFAGHPLAGGLTGYVGANTTPQTTHNFGEVGGDAMVIATTNGRPKQATYYAYEHGSELADGRRAVARRVAHFPTYHGPESLSTAGQRLIVAAVDWLAEPPPAIAHGADVIDLRGDWHFNVYRKYSNMYQFFNFGGIDVTWEDDEAAQVPTESSFSSWEQVAVPSPDYSTGGLLQMVRPDSGDVVDDRTQLTDFDMFPKWSEAWFVRTVEIPEDYLERTSDNATLILSIIDDLDVVYINGTPIGGKGFITSDGSIAPPENVPADGGFDADGEFRFETSYWEVPREYEFDADLLHAGTNELAVRLYNNNSFGGFYDRPMALAANDDAVRYLKDLPTERLTQSSVYEDIVEAQVSALAAEDAAAYGATLNASFAENELDKSEQVAAIQSMFDEYDDIRVDDADGAYYWYDGAPVYSARRTITGDKDGVPTVLLSNDEHIQYFIHQDGVVTERGNMSHTYAVDYVSSLDAMQGATLRYSIYLPPSYYDEPDRTYPVVYLLHGVNSTGDSFVNVDRIEQRMNEWIDDGSVAEMIVVMPNSGKSSGYADTDAPRGPNDRQGPWASHIYVDMLDQIESNYRAISDARFRGLTGISMGGGGVFKIGLAHTDIYTSFASHMGAIPDLTDYADELNPAILPSLDFYIDHGRQDGTVSAAVSERAAAFLESIGANLEFDLRDGGHNSAFYMAGMPASMAMHSAHFIENGLTP